MPCTSFETTELFFFFFLKSENMQRLQENYYGVSFSS